MSIQTKMKRQSILGLSSMALLCAASTVNANELLSDEVMQRFSSLIPLKVIAVEESAVEGLVQLVTERGVFYITPDGEHIVAGNIHKSEPGLPNLTRERANREHVATIESLRDSFITYESPNEEYEVIVLFDSTCGWCARQHEEIQTYLDAGITVHYAAFPRQGVKTPQGKPTSTYYQLENIWCAESPNDALDASVGNATIARSTCDNKIEEHFELGNALGYSATPITIDFKANNVAEGYLPAATMKAKLDKGAL